MEKSIIGSNNGDRRRVTRRLLALATAIMIGTLFAPAAAGAVTGSTKASATTWTWQDFNSGKCLGVNGGNMTNGTKIVQFTCNGHADQSWFPVGINDGQYWEFRNSANSNKCLGVPGGSLNQGVQLVIWDCNGHNDQFWSVANLDSNPCFAIINLNSGFIIGVAGGSLANGAAVVQWPWQGHPDQHWC